MARLLIANPNTTQAVTDLVAARARAVAAPGTDIVAATARFGAAIIGTRPELAIAEHAALDLLAREASGCDAAIIAASTDSGVRAARALLPIPVVGLTEASLHMACLAGERFGTITLSARSHALLVERIGEIGLAGRCVASLWVDATPQDVLAEPARVATLLAEALDTLALRQADVVIPVGAALAGLSEYLPGALAGRPAESLRILDQVACAVALAEALLRLPPARPATLSRSSAGLDPALAALLMRPS